MSGTSTLSKGRIAAYAAAAFSTQLIAQPINIYLPQVYAKELGISLGALGLGLMLTQSVDAISQQVCGFLSDRTRTRWGARKPWIAFGATLAIVAAFFLLRPPPGIGLAWFLGWKMVYDFAWASKNVAYTAWGAELSGGYRDRIRVLGAASFAGQIGYVCNEVLPIVVFALGLTASSTYTMQVMGYYFVIGVVAVPICHAISLMFAPSTPVSIERPGLARTFAALRVNKPFQRYLAAFGIYGIGVGGVSLSFTFYDGYLKVGNWFPWLMTYFSFVTLASIPFWVWIAGLIGKHRAYAIGVSIGAGLAPLCWLAVDPTHLSQAEIVRAATGIMTIMGFGMGCSYAASTAILADVADYGELKSGEKRTAGYFAFYLLTSKIAIALGSSFAFMAVAAFGYDARAGTVNTHAAQTAMLCVYAVVPAALALTGAAIMWRFPLDARRHAVIRRRLDRRPDRRVVG